MEAKLPPTLKLRSSTNTNRRAKVYKSVGFESPLTPTLSPLDKWGRGQGVGGFCMRSNL